MIRLEVEGGRLVIHYARLSDEQRGALVSDREVAVSAGAGAGKTSTLAARFVSLFARLVEAGPPPDIASVLVLTFTEKAAQEMRERCYATTAAVARQLRTEAPRLIAAGLSPAACTRLRARWESLRDRFSGAAISTFHGFCARVLREFPAETRTPPGFAILEEGDASGLATESAVAAVDARLAAGDPSIGLLLHTFGGRAGLVEVVTTLLRARGEVGPTLREYAAGRVGEADLLARAPLSPGDAYTFLRDQWLPFANRLLGLAAAVETPFLTALTEVRDAVAAMPDDPLACYELYGAALRVLEGSNGVRTLSHHGTTGKKADWGPHWTTSRATLADLQEELASWLPRLDHLARLPNRHDRTLLEVLRALGATVLDACERLGRSLEAARAVDFTELQLRARAAFEAGGPIADELRRRHRFVMVDEFQDTDGLQWSIVEALARPDGPDGDRLFFVGDVKQAIYGFRGGDVQVFNAARRTVRHAVELSTNYRSRPELIAFFNRLFADVLGPDGPERAPWEAPFAPLAAGRKDTAGTVRVATYEGKGTDAAREAAWIARLLQEEVLAEAGPYAGMHLHDTAAHPSPPVAILLRRRRHLLTYEAALRARGIPYVVVGGVGFWSRPEVVDVANVLHGLARQDPISLVGALRSPLFGLTDQDLWDLASQRLLARFADGEVPAWLPGADRIRAAQAEWRALAHLKDHVSIGELLQALLVRGRQAWAQGLSAPGGRGAANLERLLSLADKHEQRGTSLDRFAAMLVERVDSDAADAEAAVPDTSARVAILTVHASKGLEYPVVVLPDLGTRFTGGASSGVLRRRLGDRWELACPVPDRHGPVDRHVDPGLLGLLRAHGAAVEAAEARRLFYVACTRARDHLVLVGARKVKAPAMARAASWSDLLHAHEALHADTPDWLRHETLDEASLEPPARPAAAPLPPPPDDLPERLAPILTEPGVTISPSALATFTRDPDAWYRRYVLRVPDLGGRLRPPTPESGAESSGSESPAAAPASDPCAPASPAPASSTSESPASVAPAPASTVPAPGASLPLFAGLATSTTRTSSADARASLTGGAPARAAPGPSPTSSHAPPADVLAVAAVRGEVLHGLLEDNLLDDERFARARWEAAAYGKGLAPEVVAQGWPAVAAQLATLRESPEAAAVLAAPGYAELAVRMVRGRVTLDGRIDRLCRDPIDGAWMVVDYKSVRASAEGAEVLAEHRDQLLAYSVAASRVLEARGQGRVRRAALLLTRTGRLHRLPDWTDADFAELDHLLDSVAAALDREVAR